MICGSLEWAVGSIGGFCVGTSFVTDHQRLSGLGINGFFHLLNFYNLIIFLYIGYCFSASAPPLLTQAAISALDRFEAEPQIFNTLNNCAKMAHEKFSKLSYMKISGHVLSPVKHLYLKNECDRNIENDLVDQIVNEVIISFCNNFRIVYNFHIFFLFSHSAMQKNLP